MTATAPSQLRASVSMLLQSVRHTLARVVRGLAKEKYAVFISYRHLEPDRRWAVWLHNALESFDDRILTLLIEGEPKQSFPQGLYQIRKSMGDSAVDEPLAADGRTTAGIKARAAMRLAKLRLLALYWGAHLMNFDSGNTSVNGAGLLHLQQSRVPLCACSAYWHTLLRKRQIRQ
jgi:hypothetical protein